MIIDLLLISSKLGWFWDALYVKFLFYYFLKLMMSLGFNNWNICLKFLRELIDIYMVYGGLNIIVRGLIAMNYTYNLCAQDKSFSLP